MIRILLSGTGRMGQMIGQLAGEDLRFQVVGGVHQENLSVLQNLGPVADLVIDFSHREMLPPLAAYLRRTGTPLLCGTTGLLEEHVSLLRQLGERIPVLYGANFSIGVAVLRRLAAQAAAALGEDFDIEIVETHHNKKADAPSGTARLLLEAVDPDHAHQPVYGREGLCGPRKKKEIGVHALRGGTVAGTHTLSFLGPEEELELTHRAESRRVFAAGALRAAPLLLEQAPGYYTLDQLLFEGGSHGR